MKKMIFAMAILFALSSAQAQTNQTVRQIEVTGTAESEVKPDIIYFSISLKEYMEGDKRVDITRLEKQLIKALSDVGMAAEALTLNNMSGYKPYWKKKDVKFLVGKQYRIKFQDLDKINEILSHIDDKGIESTNIDSYEYSKITELRKELKIKALMAAKGKAEYLLNSIGEKLGGAISISEIEDNNNSYFSRSQSFMSNTIVSSQGDQSEQNINFKQIKYKFQIKAVFEIVK